MAEDTEKGDIRTNGRGSNSHPTPFQQFEDFVRKIAAVPKEELDEQRAKLKREKGKKTDS